jgi:transcriptional regulator with XRE-family HTH domain
MKNFPYVTPPPVEVGLGHRLRQLRLERGLSIRILAEQSGLNVNTLSLIENGKTSPSVSTLQQIAAALRTPITVFFDEQAMPQAIIYQKAAERQAAGFAHGTLTDLGIGFTSQALEPFIVMLEPESQPSDTPIVHTGFEFVFCLEGQVCYEVDGTKYILEPGDSLLFEAHLPHRWRNCGKTPSRSLLLLAPADMRDHPDERHFTDEI